MDHLDDEIDADLRELFSSDRLDVAVRSDAEEIIVSGARRVRRRRIMAATASGALGVVAAVVAGFILARGTPDAMPPATSTTTRPPAGTSIEVSSLPTESTAQAPPLVTTTPTTTTPKPPATKTKTSVTGPPDLNYLVLGPSGLRSVHLGQTLEEAQASGMLGIVTSRTIGGCDVYQLISDDRVAGFVYIGSTVQEITADPAQTPQGVGPGWTVAQVKEVYPDVDEETVATKGEAVVPVPGNSSAVFRLGIPSGKVTSVSLEVTKSSCWS